jgi:hypothetical protein
VYEAVSIDINPTQRLKQAQGDLQVSAVCPEELAQVSSACRLTLQLGEKPPVPASEHDRYDDEAVGVSIQNVQHQPGLRLTAPNDSRHRFATSTSNTIGIPISVMTSSSTAIIVKQFDSSAVPAGAVIILASTSPVDRRTMPDNSKIYSELVHISRCEKAPSP